MPNYPLIGLLLLVSLTSYSCQHEIIFDQAVVRESEVKGLVGESVRLPCEVDKEACGPFHSIKWYKGDDRVFIFSEVANLKRPEGILLERTKFHYSQLRKENWLEIRPLRTEDEGKYKCEITYYAVEEACSVVQFVNLKTLARPTSFELSFGDGSPIANGTVIGPFLEGTDVSVQCRAGGAKPVPSVRWYNGTRNIRGRFQSTVDDDGLFVGATPISLIVTRYDLRRTLKCEIENAAMSKPAVLSISIDVDVAPLSVEIRVDDAVVIEENDRVSVVCIVKGAKPKASISWFNGSTPFDDVLTTVHVQEDTTEIESSDGTFESRSKLTFRGTRYENGVLFSCRATNDVLEKKDLPPMTSNITLDVQFAPTVVIRPENLTLNETMDFIIFCEYTANPMELKHVYWYLDTHQLDVVGKPHKYKNGNTQHSNLFVTNASADDMGEYTCRLSNSVGHSEVTNSAYVSVQHRPIVHLAKETEGPISEVMQTNLTLACEIVRANPKILTKVRWFYDGQPLKLLPDCDENDQQVGDFCYVDPARMLLENVTRTFSGNYSCEGMNSAGWGPMSAPTPVIVYHKPNSTYIQYQPETVIKGYPLTLTCHIVDPGRPVADVFRWTRNSLLVPDKTSQNWIIDSASLETKATYSCVSMNSQGETSPSYITVDVLAEPTFITRPLPYQGALYNAAEVFLICRVECSPNCTISWLKDNVPLNNNTHYYVKNSYLPSDSESGDFESVLSKLSWNMAMWPDGELHKEKDNANYTCESSANVAGDGVSADTIFRVEYPPENIELSNRVLEVRENEISDKIDCFASAYPEPIYYWIYNNETVITGNVLNLGIPMKRDRAGKYTCVAENGRGKRVAVVTLDVLFKPECKIDREDSGSGNAATILLICRAYANPDEFSFRWRFGNETLMDSVESFGVQSEVRIEASPSSLGTYYCYVNNSVGESIPCEIDVTGVAGILETLGDDNVLLYAIIAGSIIIAIIIIIILIIFCRRQRQRGKYSEPSKKDKTPNSEAPGNNKNTRPNSPILEGPTFYENLPFHGIQLPPHKPLLTGFACDMDYADVDYATYTYGPIPYKAASVQAATVRKEEKEAETKGVPVRPPRKTDG